MKTKGIFFAVGGLVAFYFYRLYTAAARLSFTVGSVRKFSLKNGVLSWEQGLNVVNPSSVSVPVNAVDVDTYINDKLIGTAILANSTTIVPQRQTELRLLVQVSIFDFANVVGAVIGTVTNREFKVQFKGRIWSANIPVPLDETFKLNFNQF
jgi:LEA14-like dessication related protein